MARVKVGEVSIWSRERGIGSGKWEVGSGERVFKVGLEVNHTIKNRFAIRVFFLLCNQENGLYFQVK